MTIPISNFGKKIKNILHECGYNYKICCKQHSDYETVTIYADKKIETTLAKRSLRLVAWKDQNGKWRGDMEAVKSQCGAGDKIYSRDYHSKIVPLKYVTDSDCFWQDNENYAKNEMLKVLKSWN